MHDKNLISIWFFIGALLLIYGVAILTSSLISLGEPAVRTVVLAELNAPVWWGVLLIVLGAIYVYHFAPWKKR